MRRSIIVPHLVLVVMLGSLLGAPAQAAPDATAAIGCDPLDPGACLYPMPNDFFTRADASTDTGLRVNLLPTAMPRNTAGKPIDPTEFNRNDGWSPGALIETLVPGIDLAQTGAPSIADPRTSLSLTSPIIVINATTGQPHPVFAELDAANAGATIPGANPVLLIRPAINFDEGTRYIVALRDLKRADGSTIAAGGYFAQFRDGGSLETTLDPLAEARRPHMENIFSVLTAAGVARGSLFLAWDFTVAGERNLSERILHMRDDAFSTLGDTTMGDSTIQGVAPTYTITQVTNYTAAQDARIARQVQGAYVVPNYLSTPNAAPGGRFVYGVDGLPVRNPAPAVATFTCQVPRAALSDSTAPTATTAAARPSLYGHGLLGTQGEITAGNIKDMGNTHNFLFCATDWAGMSTYDAGNVVHSLGDMSNFSTMADRMQQGFVNFMFLGRLLIHPSGLAADPAFKGPLGQPLIDTTELFYDGNSQGGIMGGALVAVSPDVHRAVLGVPGMNYSTLLDRSSDWGEYYAAMNVSYPNRVDQELIFSLIQLLWDRGEANGYAKHMTDDPYVNTPAHAVLLHQAFGDYQVANITTEIEARTIGAAIYQPSVTAAKVPAGLAPFWGMPDVASFEQPYRGSVYVNWESPGRPWPPLTNTPPNVGGDPHSRPRSTAAARAQKSAFLSTDGYFLNVCGTAACIAP